MLHSTSRPFITSAARHANVARCARRTLFPGFRGDILAIETSCDDTSVAAVNIQPLSEQGWATPAKTNAGFKLRVDFHDKVTANNDAYSGIHPLVALHSHQTNLAPLVQRALASIDRKPQLICATRGPGMRSNLSVGLDTAKGLTLGLGTPFIGVHHMQAHALTPRLVYAMSNAKDGLPNPGMGVEYPFLTALVSGGHTLLLDSKNGIEHTMLAETQDIALGDCIDKAARAILQPEMLRVPYGKALEDFAFPNGEKDYDYTPPKRREDEIRRRQTKFNWSLGPPLADSKGGDKSSRRMVYSFAGLLSAVERSLQYECDSTGRINLDVLRTPESITLEERRKMARELQRVAFEHFASRIMLHLSSFGSPQPLGSSSAMPNTLVVSGGVASNAYLRHVLRSILDVRGYEHIELNFPPVQLCTDNALMIAWAGFEMALLDHRSELDVGPIRKWSMDPRAEDGGILGVSGWLQDPSSAQSTN